ncbi:MAG TPA: hypothetical protein VL095_15115, partial [Flavisolibacter sp.]|nr:hypothetical protein [Flavisolibacter sp.]
WQTYWTAIAILSFAYYLTVYLLYFRKGLVSRFQTQNLPVEELTKTGLSSIIGNNHENIDKAELQAQSCFDEINAFFEEKKKSKTEKNELLYGLHGISRKYSSLKDSPYSDTLSNIMVTQSESICSVHLDVDEVKAVWLE